MSIGSRVCVTAWCWDCWEIRRRFTYKYSRRGDCEIDQVVPYVLRGMDSRNGTIPFEPYGYDERQLCSPGFNLPVGRLTRSVNGGYPQYHSSADDLGLISAARLQEQPGGLQAHCRSTREQSPLCQYVAQG